MGDGGKRPRKHLRISRQKEVFIQHRSKVGDALASRGPVGNVSPLAGYERRPPAEGDRYRKFSAVLLYDQPQCNFVSVGWRVALELPAGPALDFDGRDFNAAGRVFHDGAGGDRQQARIAGEAGDDGLQPIRGEHAIGDHTRFGCRGAAGDTKT